MNIMRHNHDDSLQFGRIKRPRFEETRRQSEPSVQITEDDYQQNIDNLRISRQLSHDLDACISFLNVSHAWALPSLPALPEALRRSSKRFSCRSSTYSHRSTVSQSDIPSDLKVAREHINDLRRKKHRLEDSVRCAKEREEKLKTQLHKLNESKSRTEKRLHETMEGKDNLENEVRSLTNVNGRLVKQISDHHGRLSAVEEDQEDLAHRIEILQEEREYLHTQLADSHREIASLQTLDAERQHQLQLKMRQAAAVENRLLAALDRFNALSVEYSQKNSQTMDLEHAQDDAQNRLDLAARMLRAVEESAEDQRTRIESLEEKEQILISEIGQLVASNDGLEKELESARSDLALIRRSMKGMSDHMRFTEDHMEALRQDAEKAAEHTQILEVTLAQSQAEATQAMERLQVLRDELTEATEENENLIEQLNQSETDLNSAVDENKRLVNIVEHTNGDLKLAEASLEALSMEFGSFAEEADERFQQNEHDIRSLKAAKDMAEEKLVVFEEETHHLAEVNLSLQHVVNSFGVNQQSGLMTSADSSPVSSRQSKFSGHGREPVIEEGDLAEELCVLQDNMTKLHAILTRIRMRRDMDHFQQHSKKSPGADSTSNSPRPSLRSIRRLGTESPSERSIVNFSRLSQRENELASSRESSPGTSMIQSAKLKQLGKTTIGHTSWSSSDSTLFAAGSTPTSSSRRLQSVSPTSDPFLETGSEESQSEKEPQTTLKVADASQRLQRGLLKESKQPSRYLQGLRISISKDTTDPALRSPFLEKVESTPQPASQLPVSRHKRSAHRTSQDAIRSAMLRSTVAVIRGENKQDTHSNKVLPMSPEDQEQFAAFKFTASAAHDVGTSSPKFRSNGIGKAKVRKLGSSFDKSYPVMAFGPQTSFEQPKINPIISEEQLAPPSPTVSQKPSRRLVEFARNNGRDFDDYSSTTSSSSASRRSRETDSSRSVKVEVAVVAIPGRKRRIAKLLGM